MNDLSRTSASRLDLVLLGATGFTGRQAVRHLAERYAGSVLRWGVAGRDRGRLEALVDAEVPSSQQRPTVLVADTTDPASLRALAGATRVLVNLAGPYARTGEAVIEACIAQRTHYLDLTGETFWIREMVTRRHEAAQAAGVKIVPCCGYEALPFDIATLLAASEVQRRFGVPCAAVDLVVRFTGKRIARMADAVSGGTVASMSTILALDRTDSVRNPACLVPDATDAAGLRRVNAYTMLPRRDPATGATLGPTLPAPFVNPPVVLRSAWLLAAEGAYATPFRYREGTDMRSLAPRLPSRGLARAAQWAAAASMGAMTSALAAAVAGPMQLQRKALERFVEMFAPAPGTGPADDVLAGSGYAFALRATTADGREVHGELVAHGHPGYRSTPRLLVEAAIQLADPTVAATPHFGVVTPAAALGTGFAARLPMADVTLGFAAPASAGAPARPARDAVST